MASVVEAFAFVAIVILMGFGAGRVFQATRFPDIPILLILGILLGPVNTAATRAGWGNAYLADHLALDALRPMAPYLSAAALIVILFDAGLRLDFQQFQRSIAPAAAHTVPVFLLTVLSIAAAAWFFFGMPVLIAVLLGVALSNVGQTVSAAVIRHMRMREDIRSMYFVEMALYDLLSIPILVSIIAFVAASGTGADTATAGLAAFAKLLSISVLLGGALGAAWIVVLEKLRGQPLSYMLTFAALLGLFSLNQTLGGSGAVSVLLFGLVIGNREIILRRFGRPPPDTADEEKILGFHEEITFFVRTAYFLFLGITFSTGTVRGWPVEARLPGLDLLDGTAILFAIGAAAVLAALIGSRYVAVRYVSARNDPARKLLFPVFGRGLGTAVLATLPFIHAAYTPGTRYHDRMSPWEPIFTNTALLVIFATVLASAALVWRVERQADVTSRPEEERSAA